MEFKHTESGKVIHGRAMNEGEVICASDFFPSTTGDWLQAGWALSGLIVQSGHVLWVRPEIEI